MGTASRVNRLAQPSKLWQTGRSVRDFRRPNDLRSRNLTGGGLSRVILSGIQPTGVPHLGNYLGALKPWLELQDRASEADKLIFCIVDLHALTSRPSPARLRQWKTETLAALLAMGLNPERCTIFFQSEVPAHAELMWVLSNDASMGYLSRMTQWKSKLALPEATSVDDAGVKANLRLGLFSYPVLQAADVLAYDASHVPVGHDQKQHLEFVRECAQSFNRTYGSTFKIPDVLISPAKRVKSLSNPTKKMSKSIGNPNSRILLTDSAPLIRAKIMSALTDSLPGITFDAVERPGVSNLLEIIGHMQGITISEVCDKYKGSNLKILKEDAAVVIADNLEPIRSKLSKLLDPKQKDYLNEVAALGRNKAADLAAPTMRRVFDALGLRRNS